MLYSRQKAVSSAVLIMAGFMPLDAKAHDFFLDDEEQLIDTLHTHLYSSLKCAHDFFSFDEEQLINTLHTHLYASSLRLPSSQEFQVSSVCFISDTEDCSGYLFGNTEDLIDGDPEDYNR